MSTVAFIVALLPSLLSAQKYVNAPDNVTDWHFICDQIQCEEAIITCPTDANCNISCDSGRACLNAQINWPINGYGSITSCLGESSCIGVNFPILNPNKNYTLNCGGVSACSSNIYCPTDSNCHIDCIGDSSCYHSTIHWPQNGIGTISCMGLQSCYGASFPIPDPNTDFTFNFPARTGVHSTIYCPQNANCNIGCLGYYSCDKAKIFCPNNGNCNVTCTVTEACPNTNISWTANGNGVNTLNCLATNACINVPDFPTSYPTYQPTNVPSRHPTNNPSNINQLIDDGDSEKQNSGLLALYIVGSVVLVCVVIFIVLIKFKMRKSAQLDDISNKDTEMASNKNPNAINSIQKVRVDSLSSNISKQEEYQNEQESIYTEQKIEKEPGKVSPIPGDYKAANIDVHVKKEQIINVGHETKDDNMMVDPNDNDVKHWLSANVGLLEYYTIFMENGYEKLEFIVEIKTIKDLKDIGVVKKGHQKKIMTEIELLRKKDGLTPIRNEETEGYAKYPTPTNGIIMDRETNGNDSQIIDANVTSGEFIIS